MARRTLLLLTAILLAAFGTALVWLYVQGADARAADRAALTQVWVATSTIPEGSTARHALQSAALVAVPSQVAAGAVTPGNRAGIAGRLTRAQIPAGSPLYLGQFTGRSTRIGPLEIPTDRLVMTLELPSPQRVAYLTEGMHVAVFVSGSTDGQADVRLLARSVKVLDVAGSLVAGTKPAVPGAPGPGTVTIEVSQAELEKIIVVQKGGGQLWFVVAGDPDALSDTPATQLAHPRAVTE